MFNLGDNIRIYIYIYTVKNNFIKLHYEISQSKIFKESHKPVCYFNSRQFFTNSLLNFCAIWLLCKCNMTLHAKKGSTSGASLPARSLSAMPLPSFSAWKCLECKEYEEFEEYEEYKVQRRVIEDNIWRNFYHFDSSYSAFIKIT